MSAILLEIFFQVVLDTNNNLFMISQGLYYVILPVVCQATNHEVSGFSEGQKQKPYPKVQRAIICTVFNYGRYTDPACAYS
jgi:hypothetical protein